MLERLDLLLVVRENSSTSFSGHRFKAWTSEEGARQPLRKDQGRSRVAKACASVRVMVGWMVPLSIIA